MCVYTAVDCFFVFFFPSVQAWMMMEEKGGRFLVSGSHQHVLRNRCSICLAVCSFTQLFRSIISTQSVTRQSLCSTPPHGSDQSERISTSHSNDQSETNSASTHSSDQSERNTSSQSSDLDGRNSTSSNSNEPSERNSTSSSHSNEQSGMNGTSSHSNHKSVNIRIETGT